MFKVQIKAGAKLLDKKLGIVWLERQDLEKLDLSETCNCVVGQAYPDRSYISAISDLFGIDETDDNEDHLFIESEQHGFTTSDYREYPTLTEEWKQFIQERMDKQAINGR